MWHSYLGDKASPVVLVEAIGKSGLSEATALRDRVKKEFQLDN